MNPGTNESAGINLPPPVEQLPAGPAGGPEMGNPLIGEQAGMGPEQAAQIAAMPATTPLPLPATHAQQFAQDDVVRQATSAAQSVVPVAMDDGDLIEKEWVTKAKQLVDNNRDDPYKQSEEMTLFRADYMQKRYNKIIKASN